MSEALESLGSRDLFAIGKLALELGDRVQAINCLRLLMRLGKQRAVTRTAELDRLIRVSRLELRSTKASRLERFPHSDGSTSCKSADCPNPPFEAEFYCLAHKRM